LIVSGLQQHVDGWTSAAAGDGFHVLTPDGEAETWDTAAQAEALWSACEGLSPDTGSQLCVTAVRMLQNAGDQAAAVAYAEATLDRIETPVVRERMAGLLHAISPELVS
jgi:hypothetical protein